MGDEGTGVEELEGSVGLDRGGFCPYKPKVGPVQGLLLHRGFQPFDVVCCYQFGGCCYLLKMALRDL